MTGDESVPAYFGLPLRKAGACPVLISIACERRVWNLQSAGGLAGRSKPVVQECLAQRIPAANAR